MHAAYVMFKVRCLLVLHVSHCIHLGKSNVWSNGEWPHIEDEKYVGHTVWKDAANRAFHSVLIDCYKLKKNDRVV